MACSSPVSYTHLDVYKRQVGDRLTLDGHTFKVAGITENYVGHFIYMDQASYQKIYGKRTSANSYLVQLRNPSTRKVQTVSRDMMDLDVYKRQVSNTSNNLQLMTWPNQAKKSIPRNTSML